MKTILKPETLGDMSHRQAMHYVNTYGQFPNWFDAAPATWISLFSFGGALLAIALVSLFL